MKVIYT